MEQEVKELLYRFDIVKNNEYSKEKFQEIQLKLKDYIILHSSIQIEKLQYIAGVDLAYWKEGEQEKAVCCIVIIDFSTKEVIEKEHLIDTISFPYIAGYLSFRELPLIIKTAQQLKVKPDLYIFDGNGYLHPRHMGIATHASFYLDTPTIGVAKNYYKIKDNSFTMPANQENAYEDIIIENEVYGRVLRTHKNVKPIFLSAGNYIDLETSMQIIKTLVTPESHIPIPTRLADLDTHEKRKDYQLERKE